MLGIDGGSTRASLLARGAALQSSELSLANFLLQTVNATDPQDLASVAPEQFEAILRQSHTRLGKLNLPALPAIDIWAPYGATETSPMVVDVVSNDMPFIVDSVLAAIRAHGGRIRLIAHPVLSIDPVIRPLRVLARATEAQSTISFMQVHIDPIEDPAVLSAMSGEIAATLGEVERAVSGWKPMLERLEALTESFAQQPPRVQPDLLREAAEFLAWLAQGNFTFLGMRDYSLVREGGTDVLLPVPDSGLGILSDAGYRFVRSGSELVEMAPQHAQFLREPDPLLVTKASRRTRVHRRAYMDYVGIKLYDEAGAVSGELRVLGLFTSMALATPHAEVPIVRRKVEAVSARSGLDPRSHAGKALSAALDTYPRDELFQIGAEDLFAFATLIAALFDRPRVRVLPRRDRFDNFVSILMFMPRDRYNSELRARIGNYLAARYGGRLSAWYPHFPEGELVRVHFIIGRDGSPTPRPDRETLEADIEDMALTFADRLLAAAADRDTVEAYLGGFSAAYDAAVPADEALADIAMLRSVGTETAFAVRLLPRIAEGGSLGLKIYHLDSPIPLSDRVPMLENFGFRVIDERTDIVRPTGETERYLHDMLLEPGGDFSLEAVSDLLASALLAVWRGEAENDDYNALVVKAAMPWGDAALLRALGRYLRQLDIGFSQAYLARTLANWPDAARALVDLFSLRLSPNQARDAADRESRARAAIAAALDATPSLDEERILRRFLSAIDAALRTNAFQHDETGAARPTLAIKFDSAAIEGMPKPAPYREIFVYSPRVEGIHLRFGPIARGGLRWSDRPEDFRTEVLGLVKAQQVKNAVIVPVGAKGGFVPKLLPAGDRDAILAEGTEAYRLFVSALLDLTDSIEGDRVVAPHMVRRDGDDPYLVVAADKGTASFSDTANAIAAEHGFWLGDAFASGGSAGYDHKKMGITARGAWEGVKRHFREMGRDAMRGEFTAIGVGDMSGDVFGNGMLLSPALRLVAAFDHRHIFIDPDPNPAEALAERRRLFELPRSSWQDYDPALISTGGGVFPRSAKSIRLTPEARAALGIEEEAIPPNAVIAAILCADVDLIWFGGIGTYVRGPDETDLAVGDRANDAIRITGNDLRARVIAEGANLALTQKARIAYALRGGRINTDAIDNSAGVNASDLEVNIKIALAPLLRSGGLTEADRNTFIASMTPEVAALCTRNNYQQTLALSLAEREGPDGLPDLQKLMEELEEDGDLDRKREDLPDKDAIALRRKAGLGLTRPELAVLLAHAKLSLNRALLDSDVPDDPYLSRELERYFPPSLIDRFPEAVNAHRLRREIVATVLANAMINRGGPAFATRLADLTSAGPDRIAAAFALARDVLDLTDLNRLVDQLDGSIPAATQLSLYSAIASALGTATLWYLRNVPLEDGLAGLVMHYRQGVTELRAMLPRFMPRLLASRVAAAQQAFEAAGTPGLLSRRVAELLALTLTPDIVSVADRTGSTVPEAAAATFAVIELFRLGTLGSGALRQDLPDRFDRLALDRAEVNLMRAVRDLAQAILTAPGESVAARLSAWQSIRVNEFERVASAVSELTSGEPTLSRLAVAAGLLSDLARG